MTDSSEFTFSSAIHGFQVHRHSWTLHIGQHLHVERELDNAEDRFEVAVVKVGEDGSRSIVGHIAREPSRLLSHFMAHGGDISCEVKGRRQRSPLSQGLEIPCYVILHGKKKLVAKAQTLVTKVLT